MPFRITSRILGYSVLLVLLIGTLSALLAFRSDVETTLLRTPGQMYQQLLDGRYSNLYNLQIANKTFRDISLQLELTDSLPGAEIRFVGPQLKNVSKDSLVEAVLFIVLPESGIKGLKTPVSISVLSEGKEIDRVKTNFMGPVTR